MSTQTLKSIATRGSMLVAAAALLVSAVIPTLAYADALNPLTERSLLLTSSAPGFVDTDGSGNSFAAPNSIGENYAPAGTGPNGKKSGETFTFRVSTTAAIKAFTLQYCTSAAGKCQAPGDNTGDARALFPETGLTDDLANADTSAWEVRTPNRQTNAVAHPTGKSDFDSVGAWTQGAGPGQFQIYTNDSAGPYDPEAWTAATSTGWELTASNRETLTHSKTLTGKNNYLVLANDDESQSIANGEQVKIVFNPSENIYLTNPGSGSFFVKMNTYDSATTGDLVPGGAHNIDGGVTVANVMTDSIHITTKVLETMSFSVGTKNPDKEASVSHGICDSIPVVDQNRLNLGDPDAEYSLSTQETFEVFSYWRLSSNSSGGASVYYSGDTLRNTVGDYIKPIGTTIPNPDGGKDYSHIGTEQFGLGFVDAGADGLDTSGGSFDPEHELASLEPLDIQAGYEDSEGDINETTLTDNAQFSFDKGSMTVPALIAQNNDEVISCATAKMRYVANIAADTPAGVYTTKVNYLAAPQY